jgi:hypothetical protein
MSRIIPVKLLGLIQTVPTRNVKIMAVNSSIQLHVEVAPFNATNKGIIWTLVGTGSISQTGIYSSSGTAGVACIQAVSAANPTIKSRAYIINVIVPLTGFQIAASSTDIYRTISKKPCVAFLSIIPSPPDATSRRATYTIDNKNIAIVNASGIVMAQTALGTATITAKIADPINGILQQTIQIRSLR